MVGRGSQSSKSCVLVVRVMRCFFLTIFLSVHLSWNHCPPTLDFRCSLLRLIQSGCNAHPRGFLIGKFSIQFNSMIFFKLQICNRYWQYVMHKNNEKLEYLRPIDDPNMETEHVTDKYWIYITPSFMNFLIHLIFHTHLSIGFLLSKEDSKHG